VFIFLFFAITGDFSWDDSRDRGVLRDRFPRESLTACRYSAQQSFLKYTESSNNYQIGVISDMDLNSKMPDGKKWRSIFKKGIITRDPDTRRFSVTWHEEVELLSPLNEAGRGMELSDLTYYNGDLFVFDDRTGLMFKIVDKQVIPYRILMDGNGKNSKGQKTEWATVKDGLLYVGSTGKEWTTPKGEFVNNNPQWVKTVDKDGRVLYEDWLDVFETLRRATGTLPPGYLFHEAVRWHPTERRWYFLPRRASTLPYDEEEDELRGTNLIISLNEQFGDVKVTRIGTLDPTHGFSAFQFVPWHENEVIALKTREVKGEIATYIMAFDLDGTILLDEEKIGGVKFEGLEFI